MAKTIANQKDSREGAFLSVWLCFLFFARSGTAFCAGDSCQGTICFEAFRTGIRSASAFAANLCIVITAMRRQDRALCFEPGGSVTLSCHTLTMPLLMLYVRIKGVSSAYAAHPSAYARYAQLLAFLSFFELSFWHFYSKIKLPHRFGVNVLSHLLLSDAAFCFLSSRLYKSAFRAFFLGSFCFFLFSGVAPFRSLFASLAAFVRRSRRRAGQN